uniref:Reverse transcriptase domain-containing protein n=1 Tax=Tanacetum cinerariifolium TaxID=118510 RepID=A0A699I4V3_TANCI|nr:reverse transcriptase domain-containing protein [Tanacetum cinerariifolium]GEZ25025.1 reverse transcriptase domain-containing protein [Tanacetum cinerariifolium]
MPTAPTEVRKFLGLASYYRRFIEGFSLIFKPLTKLTQKNKKYEWGKEEEEPFQLLKQKLCCAPILALPKGSEDFVKELNMRQCWWIELLSDYDCEICYHPGKANVVADALSRKQMESLKVRALTPKNSKWVRLVLGHCRSIDQVGTLSTSEDDKHRQKSYADVRRRPLDFKVGDKVMLKVSPWKGVIRFGKSEKLSPRYIRPFKVLERFDLLAYELELATELQGIHKTFHVSNLKKCLSDESLIIPLDEIQLDSISLKNRWK